MIKKFINDVCDELSIPVPEISFDTSFFPTPTTLAVASTVDNIIYIKPFDKENPDLLFAVAHELRHLWQIRTNKELYLKNYKTRAELDVEAYNLQLAEVDANAFASIIMINWFGLQPLYQGMSDTVVAEIKQRINQLKI